jgi:Polyketide cyclase / dehydrase and lipid transport
LTEYTAGHSFAYELSEFTNVLRRLVHGVRGEWTFTPDGNGTMIRWTYEFKPLRGRYFLVRRALAPSGAAICRRASRRRHAWPRSASHRLACPEPRVTYVALVSFPRTKAPPPVGGRSWWAHFEFTRINITPTILRKKFEDQHEFGAFFAFVPAIGLTAALGVADGLLRSLEV